MYKRQLPLMADIHFDPRLALAALKAGCRAIRIDPGNMSGSAGLAEVIAAAKDTGAVIRIGANGGSLNNAQMEAAGGDRGCLLYTSPLWARRAPAKAKGRSSSPLWSTPITS